MREAEILLTYAPKLAADRLMLEHELRPRPSPYTAERRREDHTRALLVELVELVARTATEAELEARLRRRRR